MDNKAGDHEWMNEDERDDNGHLDCCVEFEVKDGQQGKG